MMFLPWNYPALILGRGIMRLMIIGILTLLIGGTSAFAQQQQKPAKQSAPQTGCPSGYDNCVRGGMKMGYSQTEAGGYCTRRCGGR
jgi:hypothetical protein